MSPEEEKEVDEAFAIAEQKARARGFIQARQAIQALDCYTYKPSSKSGPKGKGKKGKGKFPGRTKGPSNTPPGPTSFAATEDPHHFLGAAVGDPSYSGCFIGGDKSHDFRSCPKRASARSGKGARPGHVNFVDAGRSSSARPRSRRWARCW